MLLQGKAIGHPRDVIRHMAGKIRRRLDAGQLSLPARREMSGVGHEEREEILKALWQIVSTFVLYGFEVHPVQQSCGQLAQSGAEPTDPASDVLDSSQDKLAGRFNGEPDAE